MIITDYDVTDYAKVIAAYELGFKIMYRKIDDPPSKEKRFTNNNPHFDFEHYSYRCNEFTNYDWMRWLRSKLNVEVTNIRVDSHIKEMKALFKG